MISHTFPLVEVAGSAYEMGRQHGEQAASLVERYLRLIERLTGRERSRLCDRAAAFLPRLEAFHPALVQEVRGLAEGADISFEEALLCQVRAEAAPVHAEGCTAFLLPGKQTATGGVLAGQNQDLPTEFSDVGIILRIRPSDGRPRAIMFTFAGQLGYAGLNEHGVANFANSLSGYVWQPGLPFYPLRRAILEQPSVDGCIQLLAANRSCSAANLAISDGAERLAHVEVRPEGIAVQDGASCPVHTNHYVTSEFRRFEDGESADSPRRFDRAERMLSEIQGGVTLEALQKILGDHDGDPAGICRHGGGGTHSIAGYIAEPGRRLFHVRRGHGCLGTWNTYEV